MREEASPISERSRRDVTNTYGSVREVARSGHIEMDSNQFEIFRYET